MDMVSAEVETSLNIIGTSEHASAFGPIHDKVVPPFRKYAKQGLMGLLEHLAGNAGLPT